MFASAKSALLSSSSTNNNNPGQPIANNQQGVFSTSAPQFTSVHGVSPSQMLGSTGGGLTGLPGGLFANSSSSPQQGGGLFGTSSASGGSGLFLNQPEPTGGLFGGHSQPSGLFANTSASGSSGLFPNQPEPSGGLFGGPSQSSGGLFGNPAPQQTSGSSLFSNPPQQAGGLLGSPSQPSGGLFGNPAPQQTSSGSLFPNPPQQAGGLLGSPSQPSGGLFGNPATSSLFVPQQTSVDPLFSNAPQPSRGLFGNPAPQQTSGSSLFPNPPQQAGGLLGSPSQPSGGLFGNPAPQQASGSSLFPNPSQQAGGLFGGPSQQPVLTSFGTSTQPVATSFGTSTQPQGFGNQPQRVLASSSITQSTPTMGGSVFPLPTLSDPAAMGNPNPQSTLGTIDHIGRQHVYTDPSRGFAVASITGAIKNQGLEELRIRDFFIMRNNTLPADKKQQVENIIANNVRLRDSGFVPPLPNNIPPQNSLEAQALGFGTTAATPTPSGGLFGSAQPAGAFMSHPQPSGTAGLFPNSQPTTPPPLPNLQPAQSGSMFGAPAQPTTTPTMTFGFGTTAATPTPSGGLFGNKPQAQTITPTPSSGIFSNTNTQTTTPQPTPGTFGQPTQVQQLSKNEPKPMRSSAFGEPSPIQNSSVFGNVGVTPPAQQTVTKKSAVPTQSVQKVAAVKPKTQPTQTGNLEKQTVVSNPGSFSYEMNKMLFLSTFVPLMQRHNLSVPENLLENTDFVPQLLQFLGQYNINLPTTNVPVFQVNSVTPVLAQPSTTSEPLLAGTAQKKLEQPAVKKTPTAFPQKVAPVKKPAVEDNLSSDDDQEVEIKPQPKPKTAAKKKAVLPESDSDSEEEEKEKEKVKAPAVGVTRAVKKEESDDKAEEEEKKVDVKEEKGKEEEDGEYQKVEEVAQSPGFLTNEVSIISVSQNNSSAENLNTPQNQ